MAEDLGGRPTVMTPDVLRKLEHAFAIGCTDLEACLYANIGKSTLYDYQNENPEFLERKEILKINPVLKARTNVMASIESGDINDSKWLLERKKKDEFSVKTETDLTSKGDKIGTVVVGFEEPNSPSS
jgi:hypothetical protein